MNLSLVISSFFCLTGWQDIFQRKLPGKYLAKDQSYLHISGMKGTNNNTCFLINSFGYKQIFSNTKVIKV